MKKQILCFAISLAISTTLAGASFSDITDTKTQEATAVLNALEIMQGKGNNIFAPNAPITRAEFSKLAVVALGINDVSAYKNYSVFPDVKASHWASGYVNATIKNEQISGKEVIRGFSDGTFAPDKSITYGEATTMLVRMLGYEIEDIGASWPLDYITKAESLKLNDGIKAYNANDIMARGDIAIMLLNTLQVTPKEGDMLLLNSVSSNTIEDSILISTYETDNNLSVGQASFYENGDIVTRMMKKNIETSLIGAKGTVLFDKIETEKVVAFIPQKSERSHYVIKRSYADKIETTQTSIDVPSKTPVVLNGEVAEYNVSWADLSPDLEISVFYNDKSEIELISVINTAKSKDVFVYGQKNAEAISTTYDIFKNGVQIEKNQLQPYDVVVVDSLNERYVVSDTKITGYLQGATPSYKTPSEISIMGNDYYVSENAMSYFDGIKYNDEVTVLFDANKYVQAIYPSDILSVDNIGVYSNNIDGASVRLLNGINVNGDINNKDYNDKHGKLIKAKIDQKGNMDIVTYNPNKISGDWDISNQTIGDKKVSPSVKIYEISSDKAPLFEINQSDIDLNIIKSSKIKNIITDNSGIVIAIVLYDITGLAWDYGIASYTSIDELQSFGDKTTTNTKYEIILTTFVDSVSSEKTYVSSTVPSGITNKAIAISKNIDELNLRMLSLPYKMLEAIDTVDVTAFDFDKGVNTQKGYLDIIDNVGVYVSAYDKMISLSEAKINFDEFILYSDENQEKVYMIQAK